MKAITCQINELIDIYGEPGAVLSFSPSQLSIPGQYFLAFSNESDDVLPTVLYQYETQKDSSSFSGSIPKYWLPGTQLSIRGPYGNGFILPVQSSRVALVALPGANITPLLSTATSLLRVHTEITLLMDSPPTLLAPEIEMLPLNSVKESIIWAEAFFVVTPLEAVKDVVGMFGPNAQQVPRVEVMVQAGFVCGGIAGCGMCGVLTRKGWKLACKAGPVFPLKDLEYES